MLIVFKALSQTLAPAVLTENTSWTKEFSPYQIDKNLKIADSVTLFIEDGVVVNIAPSVSINVYGSILAKGSQNDSIFFKCTESGKSWGVINFYGKVADFKFTSIKSANRFIYAECGKISIENCFIQSSAKLGNGNDCIAVHDASKVFINHLKMIGSGGSIALGSKNDAIDLDNVDSCFIMNTRVYNFSDDGLDIGTQTKYAYIAHNVFWKTNYGISIGEETKAFVYRTVCALNDAGMEVHNKAVVVGGNNLFYANTDGVQCYHREEGETIETGGNLKLVNTIFHNNTSDIRRQQSSVLLIDYSVSNKDTLPGENNFIADAMLENPEKGDFRLKSQSPCIDKGVLDTTSNFTGLTTDIGPFEYGLNLAVRQKTSEINLQVFPNPSNGIVHYIVSGIDQQSFTISVFDMSGKKVFESDLKSSVGTIGLNNLKKGVYKLRLESRPMKHFQGVTKNVDLMILGLN